MLPPAHHSRAHPTVQVLYVPAGLPLIATALPFVSAQKPPRISPLPTIKDEIIPKLLLFYYWTLRIARAITEVGENPTEYCTKQSPDSLLLSFLRCKRNTQILPKISIYRSDPSAKH